MGPKVRIVFHEHFCRRSTHFHQSVSKPNSTKCSRCSITEISSALWRVCTWRSDQQPAMVAKCFQSSDLPSKRPIRTSKDSSICFIDATCCCSFLGTALMDLNKLFARICVTSRCC